MSKQYEAQLRNAAEGIHRAVRNPGPHPQFHWAMAAKHRTEWPLIWQAIDNLVAVVETLQKREKEETGRAGGW